jgi:CDGSH-type Zn-finger protein/uncharacterized Fe-S cluster protein YjdI
MPYTGKNMDRRYVGDAVDITYNIKRCIHAEQCIHHLETVFKKDARPWIDVKGASAQEVMNVVLLCPSGALHAEPKDGTPPEEVAKRNTISLWKDGPLQFAGRLEIRGANIDISDETRATLCRCGESRNKPFCDNSHLTIAFTALDDDNTAIEAVDVPIGTITIIPESNGPYHVSGNIEILNAEGKVIYSGKETQLCRCGHSEHKPFCDGSHEVIGFQAE